MLERERDSEGMVDGVSDSEIEMNYRLIRNHFLVRQTKKTKCSAFILFHCT